MFYISFIFYILNESYEASSQCAFGFEMWKDFSLGKSLMINWRNYYKALILTRTFLI